MSSSSLFDSFNARALEPNQVGQGFIYSSFLREVIERSNTAIIGPRGSGKTTLLKMLTLPALASWRDHRAKIFATDIDYVAIYVPADFTWYPDFRRPVQGKSQPELDDLLSYALFRGHVLLAICNSLKYMIDFSRSSKSWLRKFGLPEDLEKHDILSRQLAEEWQIKITNGGIDGLRGSVAARIKEIQYLITLSALRFIEPANLLEMKPFLAATFPDDLRTLADTCENVYGRNFRWAVCFDEVEIAPDVVKRQIWQSTRSFDPRFIVKFSASPFDDELRQLFGPKMPMPGHDFKPVYLSDQRLSEVKRFSQNLFASMSAEPGI